MTRRYTRAEFETVFNHMFGELMPGAVAQGIHEVSATQRYRTGSRLQLGSKVYHYAHAGGALGDAFGVFIANPQDIGMHTVPTAAVAGATRVEVRMVAGEGPGQDGNMPANYLEGGTVVFMTALGIYNRGILSNTAVTGGAGGNFFITVDAPIAFALVVTDSVEIIASQYADVVDDADVVLGDGRLCSVVGVPTRTAALGDWVWVQTWGPLWLTTAVACGVAPDDRLVYWSGNGSLQDWAGSGAVADQQIAGFIMANAIGGGQGAPFTFLKIDP